MSYYQVLISLQKLLFRNQLIQMTPFRIDNNDLPDPLRLPGKPVQKHKEALCRLVDRNNNIRLLHCFPFLRYKRDQLALVPFSNPLFNILAGI